MNLLNYEFVLKLNIKNLKDFITEIRFIEGTNDTLLIQTR